jgi:acetyl esterase/lipase
MASAIERVDPQLVNFLHEFPAIKLRSAGDLGTVRARVDQISRDMIVPLPEDVERREVLIPGPRGAPKVRTLIYLPRGAKGPLPVVLYLHGGGMIMSRPEFADAYNVSLSTRHGCAVVAPDYRKAPESPWPKAVEDGYAVLTWLSGPDARAIGMRPSGITLFGESGGGGVAAGLALLARDRGLRAIAGLALNAPMLDDKTGSDRNVEEAGDGFLWTAAHNRLAWELIKSEGFDTTECPIPARAHDLSGLPQTFLYVGQLDLFLRENLRWTERLALAGVPVELHVYPRAYHGFELVADAEVAKAAISQLEGFWERILRCDHTGTRQRAARVNIGGSDNAVR